MSYLQILRQLVDQQQYAVLKQQVLQQLAESHQPALLPLLALAHAHLAERQQVMDLLPELDSRREQFDVDAQVDLAGVYALMFRLPEATTLLQQVLQGQAEHSLAAARLGWCLLQQGQLQQARNLYQQSAAAYPGRLPVWCALTRLHLDLKAFAEAQQALDAGIEQFGLLREFLPEAAIEQFTAQFRVLQLEIWVVTADLERADSWLQQRRDSLNEADWVPLLLAYVGHLAGHDQHALAEEVLREALKHYSDNLSLLSQLAELAQLQGRSMQAIQLLRRTIKQAKLQDKPQVVYQVRLSSACLMLLDSEARQAAEQARQEADALEPNAELSAEQIEHLRWQAQNALALVELQELHYEQAEALFKQLLEQNQWFLPALQGLGQLLMQLGRIDEAITVFERVKQLDPARGYSALINARHFPEDEAALEQLEKVARMPSLEGGVRSGLLFQLAAAWEKRKDYPRAFQLVDEANAASRKFLRYDPAEHRNHCARIRYAFGAELYQHRSGCGHPSTLPVFVVGMPRSGTTLVEQILAGHSDIFGAGELGVIPQRIQGLNRWERHVGSGRVYPDCVDDLSPYVVNGIAEGILAELKEYDAEAKFVVDKLPHNFENIGFIKFLFPNARIISVRRDPRDIAISNYFTDYQAKHGGMGFAYNLRDIGQQLADHNLLMHHWHRIFPGQILEINYEDVVEDLEGSARRMLDYIGVEWQPQVLAFNELERSVKTASVWQVRQPIYKTSKAKWLRYQDYLSPLIEGTNAKISWEPIEMITLPEPGWLQQGVDLFRQGELAKAEFEFKKLLHFVPQHAAANFMLGLVYIEQGQLAQALSLMEQACKQCPWQENWQQDLKRAQAMLVAMPA